MRGSRINKAKEKRKKTPKKKILRKKRDCKGDKKSRLANLEKNRQPQKPNENGAGEKIRKKRGSSKQPTQTRKTKRMLQGNIIGLRKKIHQDGCTEVRSSLQGGGEGKR